LSLVRVLMIGDIVGTSGLEAVQALLVKTVAEESIDFVIANGENMADGVGITPELAQALFDLGVDVITGGNHLFRRRSIRTTLMTEPRLIRPANIEKDEPGTGSVVVEKNGVRYAVVNIEGRVFMKGDRRCPFQTADEILGSIRSETNLVFIDFHAEATSEKVALGFHVDGRATAVMGTHTHVQTSDSRVLSGGTAYVTDVGMTGPVESVIGVSIERAVGRFVTGKHHKFVPAEGPIKLEGVIVEANPDTGKAVSIKAIRLFPEV
jgi:2',3'-cyclic-nucleotide 2'-phosphodiesterase